MLTFLDGKITKRKCLLFACRCECRLEQPDCEREKVEATERYADGKGRPTTSLAALEAIGIDGVTLESVSEMDPVDGRRNASGTPLSSPPTSHRIETTGDDEQEEDGRIHQDQRPRSNDRDYPLVRQTGERGG